MAVKTDPSFDSEMAMDDDAFAHAGEDERRVRAGFWSKLKSGAARIPFAEDAASAYYCALDRGTPVRVRMMLFGALAYFLLPADTVPDFMPVLGFTDDAAVLATALNLLAGHISPTHRAAARAALDRLRAGGRA